MKYHCGHLGCDVCGARECGPYGFKLRNIDCGRMGTIYLCRSCESKAAVLAVTAAQDFGGTMIDPAKPCGNKQKGGAE